MMSDKDMEILINKISKRSIKSSYVQFITNTRMVQKKEGGPYYVWYEYFRLQKQKDFNLKFNILY